MGISYGDDLDKVEKVALEAINKIPYLKKEKPVDLYFKEFSDSTITFPIRTIDFGIKGGKSLSEMLKEGNTD